MSIKHVYDPYLFNPLFWIIRWALKQPEIRYIFFFGGSSAAKTYTISQALSMAAMEEKASSMVLRKYSVDIDDSVYADFKEVCTNLGLSDYAVPLKHQIRFPEAMVRFRGLDDSEKLKGLKGFKNLYYNELSLFDRADFNQGRKRLRGMPGQKILADWNPIISTHWIKTQVLDKEEFLEITLTQKDLGAPTKYCQLSANSFIKTNKEKNILLVKTTYLDNYWVVGHPSGLPGIGFHDYHVIADFEKDKRDNENDYRVYALGEWGKVRTGSEFLKEFDETKHVLPVKYTGTSPVHATVDINVLPYVTVGLWQVDVPAKKIKQFAELPCRSPDNNAVRAARKLSDYLLRIGHEDKIYLYGDPAGKSRSASNDDSRSFFDKFIGTLRAEGWEVVDRIQRAHPSVSVSGSFLNEILAGRIEGWVIEIDDDCRIAIDDYSMTKEDQNGGMLKKSELDKELGTSYERYGHFTDSMRYFITILLEREFIIFRQRRRRRPRKAVETEVTN